MLINQGNLVNTKVLLSTRALSITKKQYKFFSCFETMLKCCICTKPSYPESSNFLRRVLDENEGLWKGPVLIVRK